MSEVFLAVQIARLAVDIEEEGVKFYNSLVELTQNKKAKDLFSYLSKQEEIHAEFFKNLIEIAKDNPNLAVYSSDFYSYVLGIVRGLRGVLFEDKEDIILPLDLNRAMDVATDMEEKSIEAYTKIYNTLDKRFTNVLPEIINEEKQHLDSLLAIRRVLFLEDEKEK